LQAGLSTSTASQIPAAGAGAFDMAGIGSAGNALLPLAGAYGAYDLFQDRKDLGTGKGYLQGAASGAALGWRYICPPCL